jgi:hypothetical protein
LARILIIGGGFFGLYLAEQLALEGHEVRLVEKESKFMSRASYVNQARVHNGYHYPRSVLTALRSRVSFPRFVREFESCIDSDFDKYYCIGKPLGKVSAKQFLRFCERIGARCETAPTRISALTNPALIEACYSVTEYAFDANKICDLMTDRLAAARVDCSLKTTVRAVKPFQDGVAVELVGRGPTSLETVYADHVFNCTYSRINSLTRNSGLEIIPLKHELTELCLVEVPEPLKKVGLTVMCGPFFSVMPFPSAQLHSFSHVRYTPHYEWTDQQVDEYEDSHAKFDSAVKNTSWKYMKMDAARYIPLLSECQYRSSIWEVKTLLPRSESDDSRPILFLPNYGIQGFHCIMGGKIDNVYDAIDAIKNQNLIR